VLHQPSVADLAGSTEHGAVPPPQTTRKCPGQSTGVNLSPVGYTANWVHDRDVMSQLTITICTALAADPFIHLISAHRKMRGNEQ